MKEKFDLEFTQDELNTILAALAELPFKTVQPIINSIVEQFNAQVPQPEDKPKVQKLKAESVN